MGIVSLLRNTSLQEQLPIIKLSLEVDEIPVLHEMSSKVNYTLSSDLDSNVMPGHPRQLGAVYHARLVLSRCIDVADSEVCVISTLPKLGVRFSAIRKQVLLVVHTSIANI